MEITVEKQAGCKVITLAGRLDVTAAEQVREQVFAELAEEKPVILSMADCVYVSSAGLRALLLIMKAARLKNLGIVAAAATEEVMDIFTMTGFDAMLHFAPTVAAARQLLCGGKAEEI